MADRTAQLQAELELIDVTILESLKHSEESINQPNRGVAFKSLTELYAARDAILAQLAVEEAARGGAPSFLGDGLATFLRG